MTPSWLKTVLFLAGLAIVAIVVSKVEAENLITTPEANSSPSSEQSPMPNTTPDVDITTSGNASPPVVTHPSPNMTEIKGDDFFVKLKSDDPNDGDSEVHVETGGTNHTSTISNGDGSSSVHIDQSGGGTTSIHVNNQVHQSSRIDRKQTIDIKTSSSGDHASTSVDTD